MPRTDRRVLLNTGALAGSSLWRIGLSFVLQVAIASRLGSQGLGQYVTALAYLNVSQVLSELGLPRLLVRDLAQAPRHRGQAFRQALAMQFLAGILVWLGLAGITWLLPYSPETRRVLLVATASLPLFAITSSAETVFQAAERMELVMGVEMTTNALIVGASLGVLVLGGSVVHLAGVLVGTQAVSALLCLVLLAHTRLLHPSPGPNVPDDPAPSPAGTFPGWLRLLRRAQPFYYLTLANVLLHRTDILLLSVLAGDRTTGIYSAAYLVVRVFLVLTQTFWQALYPTLSRLRHQQPGQYLRLAQLAVRYGMMALLPAAALLTAVALPMMALLFPEVAPRSGAPVLRTLAWAAPLFFLASGATTLLLVEHRARASLAVALVHLAGMVALLPALIPAFGPVGAAVGVVAAIGASVGVGLYLLRQARVPVGLPRRLPWLVFAALSTGGLVGFGVQMTPHSLLWIPLAGGGALLYLAFLWSTGLLSADDWALFRRALQG